MNTEEHIQDMAKKLVNNWRSYTDFGWHSRPEDDENICLVYTLSRDSNLMDESNHEAIKAAMTPFIGNLDKGADVAYEVHSHWGVGWIEGYAIRVYDKVGEVTQAFKTYAELALTLEEYPVLNDADYSKRQHDAAIACIMHVGWDLVHEDAPSDWAEKVFSWLWDNKQSVFDSFDGDYYNFSKEALQEAVNKLGYGVGFCTDKRA